MLKLSLIVNLLILILCSGCNTGTSTDPETTKSNAIGSKAEDVSKSLIETKWYEIVYEKILDKKYKAQIELKIIIDPETNDQNLKSLLEKLYNESLKRYEFTYFDNPTNIFIYAFDSNKVTNLSSEWRGYVGKGFSQTYPDYTIKEQKEHIEESVAHIDLKTKKEIYYKSFSAEIKSRKDADKKFPDPKDFSKHADYMYELDDQYQAEICEEYNITDDEMSAISLEGIMNNWPYPRH